MSWIKRAGKYTEVCVEATNETNAWAEAAVAQLVREAVAWIVLQQMAELGLLPEV